MNGSAFGIRNRGGGSYNPDCDFCENCGEHGHEAEDCPEPDPKLVAQNEARREAVTKERTARAGIIRYVWCVIFHSKHHVQMGADVGFGVYCYKCDVKW